MYYNTTLNTFSNIENRVVPSKKNQSVSIPYFFSNVVDSKIKDNKTKSINSKNNNKMTKSNKK